ncbi:MAG: cytochrome c [Verrucomicrobiota bacterium]
MRYYLLGLFVAITLVLCVAGFRGQKTERRPIEIFDDMSRQQKVKYQKPSEFFSDGRAARMPISGTVPASIQQFDDEYYLTGAIGNQWGDGMPKGVSVTPKLMALGKEKFEVNCRVCHGSTGMGNGIVTQYGLAGVANLTDDRIRTMADGEIFNTISKGKGQMMGYGGNVPVSDRWAIICYVRALQHSQKASLGEVPETEREKLLKK